MNVLKEHFVLKEVLEPGTKCEWYLGATIGKFKFSDGSYTWYMSAKEYLKCAIPARVHLGHESISEGNLPTHGGLSPRAGHISASE